MVLYQDQAEEFSHFGQTAAENTRRQYSAHWDEDYVTWNFINNFEREIEKNRVNTGYKTEVEKIPDSGYNSAEKFTGADILLVVGLAMKDGVTGSGLMMQAKWRESWDENSALKQMVRELKSDCQDMTRYTPSSFGVVYDSDSFKFYPAEYLVSINPDRFGARGDNLRRNVPHRQTRNFLLPFLRGFSGDRWIFENLENILNTNDLDLPCREIYADGGESEPPVEIGGTQGLVLLFVDEGVEYDLTERLPFEDERLLSGLGL